MCNVSFPGWRLTAATASVVAPHQIGCGPWLSGGEETDVITEGTSHSWIKCCTTNCGVVAVVFHPGLVSCPGARWLLWWCRSAAGSETDVITEGTSHSWIKCCTTKCGVVAARIPSGSVSCPRARWLLENREPSPMSDIILMSGLEGEQAHRTAW